MIKTVLFLLCFFSCVGVGKAQSSDTLSSGIIVFSDFRLGVIGQRESAINTSILKYKAQFVKGYRLMILNTQDRNYAFKVRTQLLQNFPEQKPYMWYVSPYIRLKFGNFQTKEEAEVYQKKISKMLDGANIYLLNETIEINPGADFDPESMREVTLQ
ncbi:MAG: hypothetical protein J0H55_11155 [Chitinophagaceae bacterium]|nr:hypothetical protein [Chitinophagaceae bacterium]